MPNFKPDNYDQTTMVVINFEEQLQLDPFALTVHHLIDQKIDLDVFYNQYKNDEGGRSAYNPSILLKIILFAYYKGITSSREIQWQCEHNVIFSSLACGTVPHFTSLASFVSRFPDAIASVFEQVLLVCDEQGLLGHELLAIDGCKMPSNASKEHSGTLAELEAKRDKIRQRVEHCMKEHKTLDKRKPRERERKERLEKTLSSLNQHFDKIDQFLKTAAPRMGQGKRLKEVKSNITDNESAKIYTSKGTIQGYNGVAAVDKKHQVIIEAQAYGDVQEHHTLAPMLDGVRGYYKRTGIADDILRDQIIVTADTGFANEANDEYLRSNGINAYIPDNKFRSRDTRFSDQKKKHGKRHAELNKGIAKEIPSTEFVFNRRAKTCICPMGKEMWLQRETRLSKGKYRLVFEGKLNDCRRCKIKHQCMRNPSSADTRDGHGRQVSMTYTNGKTATDWMKRRVDSEEGKVIYGHRMSVVEPVFGNIGTNKGLRRFSLRGKKKVQGQWRLFCLVHNIEKIMNYGALA